MKQLIYAAIWIFIWLPSAKGQVWRDSLNVGQQAFQSGDYKRAMKLFRDAQDLAPDHINILDLINQSAYKSQNYQDAIKGYEQAAQNAKSAQEQSRAHYNLGNAHFRNNDVSKAIESYKEALRKDPTNEKARHNLAYAMHKKQNDQNNNDNNDDKRDDNKNNQNENKNNNNQDDKQDKENDGKNDKQDQKNDGKGDKSKGQPGKGQLSPDMTEQLLDALERSEGQTKAKMDKQKDKETMGQPRKQKDW
jgi:Ca-activated chloride channel homolog